MIRRLKYDGQTVEYTLAHAGRADVHVRVLPDGTIRADAPAVCSLRTVDGCVQVQLGALLKVRRRLQYALSENRLTDPLAPDARICVQCIPRRLALEHDRHMSCTLQGDVLTLRLSALGDADAVRSALVCALSKLALERIRARLDVHAPGIGVTYGRVTVRAQGLRWGSCNARGDLHFNWKLIMAPEEVLDYVVVHELCHRREFSHSPRFWALVERHCPDYRSCVAWLKQHGREPGI